MMKKIVCILMALAVAAALTACGNKDNNENDSKQSVSASTPTLEILITPTSEPEPTLIVLTSVPTLELTHEPLTDIDALREKYPQYFDVWDSKGLELYVWQMGENSYSFGILPGTNRVKWEDEIWSLKGVTVEEMRLILSTYDTDRENIFIYPFQHPLSSYVPDIMILREGETEEGRYERVKEYREMIKDMLFGE